jgi:L-glutamine-phosphate cytidylyltransferase
MSDAATKRLVVLAAGRGTRLGAAAEGRPKAGVELAGGSLLSWQLSAAQVAGFEDLTVMRGFRPDRLSIPTNARTMDNPVFDRTNMVYTLWLSRDTWQDGVAISYGDIVYEPDVLDAVWRTAGASRDGIAVVVDHAWQSYWTARFGDPLADAETLRLAPNGSIADIGRKPKGLEEVEGQYIGLTCFRGAGVSTLRSLLDRAAQAHQLGERLIHAERAFPDLYMTDVLQRLIAEGKTLQPAFIDGRWLEIDTPGDLALAAGAVRVVGSGGGQRVLEIRR